MTGPPMNFTFKLAELFFLSTVYMKATAPRCGVGNSLNEETSHEEILTNHP
jgi:hypothetical protein